MISIIPNPHPHEIARYLIAKIDERGGRDRIIFSFTLAVY